jgi:hypothetical protein
MRGFIAAAAALLVVFSGLSAPVLGQSAGNAVTEWNEIAVTTLVALPPPGGGAPPASQINMGMTQGAVYDAVNAIGPRRYQPYLLNKQFPRYASREAAAATAAYRVLSNIVSSVPAAIAFPDKASVLETLASKYADSLDEIADGRSKTTGIAAGKAAARAMIAARKDDGRFGPSQWVSNTKPGHWQPLLNPDGTKQLDPTPWVGGVKPFLMKRSSQFRTAGPPALKSDAWAKDFNETKALGAKDSTERTPEQTHIATFWQCTPVATWNAVARATLMDPAHHRGLAASARLLAMQNLSAADAAINCWNDKYYWDFWRPWNAIPRADEDGNAATDPDAAWTPLLSAPYPDHPSGHLCLDGSHLRVMRMFFGTNQIGFDVTSVQFPGETRHYDGFLQALAEITEARIWAGLHFRTADVQAKLLGRKVANYMADHFFQRV